MNLQEIRLAKGLSQSQLAKKSGVSLGHIRNLEQGQRDINKTAGIILYKLSKALECRIEDLLKI